jgi:hypothetical protein
MVWKSQTGWGCDMSRLPEVRDAKALMNDAMDWSVFKWLWEKSNVRETADTANAALDRLNRRVKARWSDEFKAVYRQLLAREGRTTTRHRDQGCNLATRVADPEIMRLIKNVKDMDDKAYSARMDAEKTFDEAESQLNTDLAREGCRKAIHSWELHERAIRGAEALVDTTAEKTHST